MSVSESKVLTQREPPKLPLLHHIIYHISPSKESKDEKKNKKKEERRGEKRHLAAIGEDQTSAVLGRVRDGPLSLPAGDLELILHILAAGERVDGGAGAGGEGDGADDGARSGAVDVNDVDLGPGAGDGEAGGEDGLELAGADGVGGNPEAHPLRGVLRHPDTRGGGGHCLAGAGLEGSGGGDLNGGGEDGGGGGQDGDDGGGELHFGGWWGFVYERGG